MLSNNGLYLCSMHSYILLFLVLVVNSDQFQISGVTKLPILKCSWLDYTYTLQLLLSWYYGGCVLLMSH